MCLPHNLSHQKKSELINDRVFTAQTKNISYNYLYWIRSVIPYGYSF